MALAAPDASAVAVAAVALDNARGCSRGQSYVERGIVTREVRNLVYHHQPFRPEDVEHCTGPRGRARVPRAMIEPRLQQPEVRSSAQLPPAGLTPLLFFAGSDHPDLGH